MKTILSISTDPYFNLAWEEYILKNIYKDEDIFLLWQNDTSIIVGRNQNVFEEVNLDFVVKNHIPLVRRISGGGTVFHDLGNLNYSYITSAKGKINNYKLMTEDLIKALNELGIDARFEGKSDIKINGKKISGNAQSVIGDRLLHHGTLLFNSNLEKLNGVIKQKDTSIESISVKSNRSTVTNLSEYTNMSIEEIKDYILKRLVPSDQVHTLSDKDIKRIEDLKQERYLTYQWNYGESPKSTIDKNLGDYRVKASIAYGTIEDIIVIHQGTLALNISSSLVGLKCYPTELNQLLKKHPEIYQILFE
ncbi:lipoate--protein ligase family protein [Acholeplasma hippikon]|uniref:Lipoate-protein ligase A n=1 Tax=Acholeplasma hippikon TaxID=264636 RepID=A0A449BKX1_9MOLU|nr:biotin/lipoate A/B protein ligase family protein [Acholeplasma hippikon]VEU83121.1 Lipoate-protein ligase A [Acholeplasma hippikon]